MRGNCSELRKVFRGAGELFGVAEDFFGVTAGVFFGGGDGDRAEVSVSLGHDGRPCRALYAVCSWPTHPARPRRSCQPRPERSLALGSLTEPDGIRGGNPGPARGHRAVVRRESGRVRGRI